LWEITRERISPLKGDNIAKQLPGPGQYDPIKTLHSTNKGFSFSRDMRVFDKNARDELRNAIKYKEKEYVQQYATMQMQLKSQERQQMVSSRNSYQYSIQTMKDNNSKLSSTYIDPY
jgi:Sperm-tail PG-rich repeat